MTSPSRGRNGPVWLVERLAALFDHLPASSITGERMMASQIADRATKLGRVAVGESYLSQLRSGKARAPSVWTIEALALAFEVDISFFTNTFHDRHVSLSMCDRVHLARYLSASATWEATITDIEQLPEMQQRAVFTLIDLFATRDH